ncbi:hypothetical protein Dimus_002304, partial [Dionaea muscipula]
VRLIGLAAASPAQTPHCHEASIRAVFVSFFDQLPCSGAIFSRIRDFLLSTPPLRPLLPLVCAAVVGASEPDGEVSRPRLGDGECGRCGCEVVVTRWAASAFAVSTNAPRESHRR